MDTGKLVKRVLLTAALSAGTLSAGSDAMGQERGVSRAARPAANERPQSPAAGFASIPDTAPALAQVAGRPGSDIRPTQYQPSASGDAAAPSTTVSAELQRLFQESGQQMPSMRQNDLPYATTPQMNLVRPTQRKKPNFFQKFVGRIKGESPLPTEPLAQPPQPPTYNPYANVPQGQQPAATGQGQIRNGQRPQTMPANRIRTQNMAGRPAAQVIQRPAATATSVPSAAQPRSITVSQPTDGRARTVFPTPAAQTPPGSEFVQPGRAPAFMPQAPATVRPHVVAPQPASRPALQPAPTPAPVPQPAAVPDTDDAFLNPFTEPAEEPNAEELLDLDSLISEPAEQPQPAAAAQPAEPADAAAEMVNPAEVPAAGESESEAMEITPQRTAEAPAAAGDNPFTGVQLNTSDDEFFGSLQDSETEPAEELSSETFAPGDNGSLPEPELPALAMPGDAEDAAALSPAPIVQEPVAAPPAVAEPQATPPAATPPAATPPASVSRPGMQAPASAEQLHQLSERQRRERQRALIVSRSGQSGFKGFCPVELRDHRRLVDAQPEFTSAFGLQQYQFSSNQARAAFESDPSRYAPAAGGSDVVLLVNAGEEQPGSLDYAVWYRDRLYMFRSRETLSLFVTSPQRFASQY